VRRLAGVLLVVAMAALYPVAATGADVGNTIPDVPSYLWYGGCGPTAAGMVIGYYETHGYPNMIPGDSNIWTGAFDEWHNGDPNPDPVEAMVASPGYFTDWWPTPDRAIPPSYHTDDSVADFMKTSRKDPYAPVEQGSTRGGLINYGLTGYAASRGYANMDASFSYFYDDGPWGVGLWDLLRQEVDAARPMVFYIDWTGDGVSDHFVTVVGYRYDEGSDPSAPLDPEYGCYNDYDHELHWYDFRPLWIPNDDPPSTRYTQGVELGTWFQIFDPVAGDADGDGDVDAADYLALKDNFGTVSGATWEQGDFDKDGNVDRDDLLLLEQSFGRNASHSVGLGGIESVPEPATLGLLALGGLALIRRKQPGGGGWRRAGPREATRTRGRRTVFVGAGWECEPSFPARMPAVT
jgi:hypothetical protein